LQRQYHYLRQLRVQSFLMTWGKGIFKATASGIDSTHEQSN
jgi:hypothetical protein